VKFWHLLKEASLAVLDNLFYWLSFLIPKDKNLWAFGSMFGAGYADNSKYFFEYICKYHPEVRVVWFSARSDVVDEVRRKGYEAYRFYSPVGIVLALRAGAGFISHSGVRDIRPFVFTPSTVLVNLWHGIPLKKIALDNKVSDVRNKPLFQPLQWLSCVLCRGFRRQADLLTAASEEDRRNFSTAFTYPLDKIKITGYPLNDVFFSSSKQKLNKEKKGIYVPTFRGKENSSFDFFEQFGFDIEAADKFLASLNVTLYLKLHHFNYPSPEIQRSIQNANNIKFYPKLDVYEELPEFDFLITDFSSIYFDFLLVGKPIIFAPFDRDGFEGNVRQLYYDYAEVTPGPKAQNWPELLDCIADVTKNPARFFSQVTSTCKRFHRYADGGNSSRVYKEVALLIKHKKDSEC
jgi:CDP-glycerol glycerophosphotransferase